MSDFQKKIARVDVKKFNYLVVGYYFTFYAFVNMLGKISCANFLSCGEVAKLLPLSQIEGCFRLGEFIKIVLVRGLGGGVTCRSLERHK